MMHAMRRLMTICEGAAAVNESMEDDFDGCALLWHQFWDRHRPTLQLVG